MKRVHSMARHPSRWKPAALFSSCQSSGSILSLQRPCRHNRITLGGMFYSVIVSPKFIASPMTAGSRSITAVFTKPSPRSSFADLSPSALFRQQKDQARKLEHAGKQLIHELREE